MKQLLQNRLWRGFMHVLSGNVLVNVAQGLQFFLLARVLGPAEFGQVGIASAITVLLLPYSGMGSANVMIMRAAREPSLLPLYLGNALLTMGLTGLALTVFAVLVVVPLVGSSLDPTFMLVFAASELLASKVVDTCWQAFVARDEMRPVSVFLAGQSLARLAAALLYCGLTGQPSARDWAWCALASNLTVAAGILWWTRRAVGPLRYDPSLAARELRVGAAFAVGLSAKGFYTDADKVFLARFTSPVTVATYTMAFRVVQVALVPARALSFALTARMFRAGEGGVEGALVVARKFLAPTLALGVVLAVLCYLSAPWLPVVAGVKYLPSVEVLRTLCLLPIVLALQSLLGDTLSTSGYQKSAAISQFIAGAIITVLSIQLIPKMGWRGASVSSYAAQTLLCVMLGSVIWFSRRRERAANESRKGSAAMLRAGAGVPECSDPAAE